MRVVNSAVGVERIFFLKSFFSSFPFPVFQCVRLNPQGARFLLCDRVLSPVTRSYSSITST
jgi:hypothetical protein